MITRVPKPGATIVPDKLYMVEKLSDYAVYENRFLYMMLCYLRDFINFRLEKIEKLRATYHGNMFVSKEVVTRKRKLVIETKILDDREDNPFPIKDDSSAKILQRIISPISPIKTVAIPSITTKEVDGNDIKKHLLKFQKISEKYFLKD